MRLTILSQLQKSSPLWFSLVFGRMATKKVDDCAKVLAARGVKGYYRALTI